MRRCGPSIRTSFCHDSDADGPTQRRVQPTIGENRPPGDAGPLSECRRVPFGILRCALYDLPLRERLGIPRKSTSANGHLRTTCHEGRFWMFDELLIATQAAL